MAVTGPTDEVRRYGAYRVLAPYNVTAIVGAAGSEYGVRGFAVVLIIGIVTSCSRPWKGCGCVRSLSKLLAHAALK